MTSRIVTAKNDPMRLPGKSGRRRGITIDTTSAKMTSAPATRPRMRSLAPLERAKVVAVPVTRRIPYWPE